MEIEMTIMQEESNEETITLVSTEKDETSISLEIEKKEEKVVTIEEVTNEKTLNLVPERKSETSIGLNKEGIGGTSDYGALLNKPKINGVELNGDKNLEELGIQQLEAGKNVEIVNGVISVLTTTEVEEDNTKPITSSAVYTEVGNINILLQTI